jgi:hypothetical protein
MDEISESLGLSPLPEKAVEVLPAKKPSLSSKQQDVQRNADDDYAYARDNFYNVIEKGTHALEEMLDLAKASEHPRAFEVVSTIMKTLVDANKDLVSMSEKKAAEQKAQDPEGAKQVTNNNLFVGSTAELQSMLKDMRNDESS